MARTGFVTVGVPAGTAFGDASMRADSVFQSASPRTLAISSRLSLWVMETDLSLNA
jgi:hypothetical protein